MKVKVIYTDAGGGHKAAATAIYNTWKEEFPTDTIEIIDIFQEMNLRLLSDFDSMWHHASKNALVMTLMNMLFEISGIGLVNKSLQRAIRLIAKDKFHKVMDASEYDILISTHFLSSLLMPLAGSKVLKVNIATDLVDVPAPQADNLLDLHFCATSQARERLISLGVEEQKVISGHFPQYQREFNPLDAKKSKNFILISAGGLGIGSMKSLLAEIENHQNTNFIIQAGKDRATVAKLQKRFANSENIEVIGFVNNYLDYVYSAEVVIAKPGPATILEIESLGKKAVFTNAVGPQEQGNIGYLLENPNFVHADSAHNAIPLALKLLDTPYTEFEARFTLDSTKDLISTIRHSALD